MGRIILFLTLILLSCLFACGYNVDTHFPIIYTNQSDTSARSSFFGFSVILQANYPYSWIQVGAPRGSYSNHHRFAIEPGVVFRCPISSPCKELPLNFFTIEPHNEIRDNGWIGGAMDIQTPEDGSRMVICGHKWGVTKYNSVGEPTDNNPIGICYWMDQEYNEMWTPERVARLIPLNNPVNFIVKTQSAQSIYNWGVGQAGIAVHYPRGVSELLIGSPGVFNWAGNAIRYQNGEPFGGGGFQKRSVINEFTDYYVSPPIADYKDYGYFDYLGYSLQSGRFFGRDTLVYASGAPRAADFRGHVLLFTYPRKGRENDPIIVLTKKVGQSFGEYFGASLAVGDFNGDNFDDLVVGAPHFTQSHDEGCIYIFYGSDKGTLIDNREGRIVGQDRGGRFGTTVASLGDIDHDGYDDLVVGAPYEDENHGVIYIYSGSYNGLETMPSQRIAALGLSSQLRGFGISLARPADIDNNMYNDLAVGSYLSGHAVILRTQPIVKLVSSLESHEKNIDRQATNFVIEACTSFVGSHVPEKLEIRRTIVVDEVLRRAQVDGTNQPTFVSMLTLQRGERKCEDLIINLVNQQARNISYIDPIEIKMSETPVEYPGPGEIIWVNQTGAYGKDEFCKNCPIKSRDENGVDRTLLVKFGVECGEDNICDANLVLDCSFPHIRNSRYILGSNKYSLELQMEVANTGENAYLTILEVILPSSVSLVSLPNNCKLITIVNDTAVSCNIGNPLVMGAKGQVNLELDMSLLMGEEKELIFVVGALTQSNDTNAVNNLRNLTLFIDFEADMQIAGTSVKSLYSYFDQNKSNLTQKVFSFYHNYEVQKFGASPITNVEIKLWVPVSIQEKDSRTKINFIEIKEVQGKQNTQPLPCAYNFEIIAEKSPLQGSSDSSQSNEGAVLNEVERRKRDVSNTEKDYEPPANRTLFLNCMQSNVRCAQVVCQAGPFLERTVAQLRVLLQIHISLLEPLMGKRDIIYYSSNASVTITQKLGRLENNLPDNAMVSTTFLGSIPEVKVEKWLIPVCIGVGLLLLALLIMGLVKAGFFQRNKKTQLEAALASAENMDEGAPVPQDGLDGLQNESYKEE